MPGLPAASQASRACPPFQARVVKPRISTLTPQRSSVRARMSAQQAATMIGRPRMLPELSSSSVTTVSRKSASRSCLKESGCIGSMTTRVSRAASSVPSSRSKSHARFCCAISLRCSRLARRATAPCRLRSSLSRKVRSRSSSSGVDRFSAVDLLVVGPAEDLVAEGLGVIEDVEVGPPRLARVGHLLAVGIGVELVGIGVLGGLGGLAFLALAALVLARLVLRCPGLRC